MEKVVIYARVSTSDGKQDESSQIEDLIIECKKQKFIVVKIFQEQISGTTKTEEREQFSSMENFIKNHKNNIDGVVCWEISRLGRKVSQISNFVDFTIDNRIFIYEKKNNLRTLTKNGEKDNGALLLLNIISSLAQNEVESIRSRIKRGLKHAALKGHFQGVVPPFGFKIIDKKLIIDEDKRGIVKNIFELYATGDYGCTKIANYLNKQKIPTTYNEIFEADRSIKTRYGYSKKAGHFQWTSGSVYSIIKNTIYFGNRLYKGEIIPVDAIISKELFNDCLEVRKNNDIKKANNTKHTYLLEKRKIWCTCGRNYYPHRRTAKDGKAPKDDTYKCISHRISGKSCGSPGIGIQTLNNSIWYFIRRSGNLKDQIKRNAEKHSINTDIENIKNEIADLQDALKGITNENQYFLSMVTRGLATKEDIEKELLRNKVKRTKVEIDLKKKISEQTRIVEFMLKQNDLNTQLKNIKGSPDEMKRMVNKIVDRINLYPVAKNERGDNDIELSVKQVKKDQLFYVELFLYTSQDPIMYVISRRNQGKDENGDQINLIMPLARGQYNKEKGILHIPPNPKIYRVKYDVGF